MNCSPHKSLPPSVRLPGWAVRRRQTLIGPEVFLGSMNNNEWYESLVVNEQAMPVIFASFHIMAVGVPTNRSCSTSGFLRVRKYYAHGEASRRCEQARPWWSCKSQSRQCRVSFWRSETARGPPDATNTPGKPEIARVSDSGHLVIMWCVSKQREDKKAFVSSKHPSQHMLRTQPRQQRSGVIEAMLTRMGRYNAYRILVWPSHSHSYADHRV